MNIAIVGTGYVGLVTGVCFAADGHTVTCIDTDGDRIRELNAGLLPFYEPGLASLLAEVAMTAAAAITFTGNPAPAVEGADLVFLTAGTPREESGRADLRALRLAVREVWPLMRPDCVLVIKSTVPPGTQPADSGAHAAGRPPRQQSGVPA